MSSRGGVSMPNPCTGCKDYTSIASSCFDVCEAYQAYKRYITSKSIDWDGIIRATEAVMMGGLIRSNVGRATIYKDHGIVRIDIK